MPHRRQKHQRLQKGGIAPFSHPLTSKSPHEAGIVESNGADEGNRTLDLRFTKPLLYR